MSGEGGFPSDVGKNVGGGGSFRTRIFLMGTTMLLCGFGLYHINKAIHTANDRNRNSRPITTMDSDFLSAVERVADPGELQMKPSLNRIITEKELEGADPMKEDFDKFNEEILRISRQKK